MTTREIGTKGESFAAQVLQKNGAEILSRNYYTPYGEIDLIVRDGNCIAFVEVKTRRQDHNPACEAVDRRKQKRIARSAVCYLWRIPPIYSRDLCVRDCDGKRKNVFRSILSIHNKRI